jgi:hypothetical protein
VVSADRPGSARRSAILAQFCGLNPRPPVCSSDENHPFSLQGAALSTTSITGTAVRDLAVTLTRKLDTDKDGKLSASEFEGFLTQFIGALADKPSLATSSPQAPAARPAIGIMSGFDAAKLANLDHTTPKYQVGRIVQGFPNTPAGLLAALPDLQLIAPDAKIVGSKGDKVDFGNYADAHGNKIGVVDLIQAAGLGGISWQWGPAE